jgi:ATP-binding cassette subfamily C (CFTR/MRP) protein 1
MICHCKKNATLQPIISVRNLSLSGLDKSQPIIKDVSFNFLPGNLTMIVGPIGCGKSILHPGILGETPASPGIVYINQTRSAFVDQTPWIQNSSIRSNIIGVSTSDPEWYGKVVYACALDSDMETLFHGDSTNAGSAGGGLSGGQKLRIVR